MGRRLSEAGRLATAGCLAMTAIAACSHPGLLSDDGTSVSHGPPRVGTLKNPAKLPRKGSGFVVPDRWWKRGLGYGIEELTGTIVYVGRELERWRPKATVSVGDLSYPRGGPSRWHRSHQNGRDVDLIFLVKGADGLPRMAEQMIHFDADGKPIGGGSGSITFDDAGNWQLVRALALNPISEIQYIIISDDLKQRIIDHAVQAGEPEAVILKAGALMQAPGRGVLPHDDHMHVRIFCPREDLDFGCFDWGRMRWHKQDTKYEHRVQRAAIPPRVPHPFHPTPLFFGHG